MTDPKTTRHLYVRGNISTMSLNNLNEPKTTKHKMTNSSSASFLTPIQKHLLTQEDKVSNSSHVHNEYYGDRGTITVRCDGD